ncbi:potassium voltage-gated channel subfamily KQT member 1-like [Babylonia areolata]|uniref:potassium voltage-gated channel subfamily KQT member 1-like n=1 Tax=Babylonia areolata TaxID=304850 RepID=UPI003FD5DE8B
MGGRRGFRGGGGAPAEDVEEGGLQSEVRRNLDSLSRSGSSNSRFTQARLSLLGKPLNYKAHRRDMRYRRLQAKIYNFLERPKFWRSWSYHFSVFLMVVGCLTLGVMSSISEFEHHLSSYALYLEVVMLAWVTTEFIIRLWSAGCRSRYQGLSGRLKFLRRPLCVIDMVLILASVTTLVVGSTQQQFATSVISGLRFFQILRMVRMDRRGGTWKLLGSVVWAHRQELVTTLYIGTLGLIFSSYFVYLAEKDAPRPPPPNTPREGEKEGSPPKFSNFADAIWWGVVTLCTVGYGDVVPTTWGGKVIASFSAVLGISFFALPAGILGSGFALKVQQQQRQKHLNRRRVPAAELIQCLWRCYAADEHSMSVATWKPHLVPCPSPTAERPWKNNTSFVSRFSTKRRDRSHNSHSSSFKGDNSAQSPLCVRHNSRRSAISNSEEEVPNVLDRSHLSLATGMDQRQMELLPVKKENSVTSICKDSEEEPDLSPRITQLTDTDKRVIRALRKIRYFVARRKFREALRPYDVKDVIEQYSAGHVDMLGRIKNLQGRLKQTVEGKKGSHAVTVVSSKRSIVSHVLHIIKSVEDIESKLDLLIDLYKEDRKILLHHIQLQQTGQGQSGGGPPPGPIKPRPILVDKQFTSEPPTPTSGGLNPNKPMQRNLSDLSQRIKKRVTYRCLSLHEPPKRSSPGRDPHHPHLPHHHHHHPLASDGVPSHFPQDDYDYSPAESSVDTPTHRPLLSSPVSAPPISSKTFMDMAGGGGGGMGAGAEYGRLETNLDDYFQQEQRTLHSADDLTTTTSSSSFSQPHTFSVTSPPVHRDAPCDAFGHALSDAVNASVASSCLTNSVLSTLSEQKSIESEYSNTLVDTSLPTTTTTTQPSSSSSSSPSPPLETSGAHGGKISDSCNGSPPMPPASLTAECEGGAVARHGPGSRSGSECGSGSGSRSDLSGVPALESLTDFHVDCDAGKLKSTDC